MNLRFGDKRMPLLGDGETYLIFDVPDDVLQKWIMNPPWNVKAWSPGPIPPEIGFNAKFEFRNARAGWSAGVDGIKKYSIDDPQLVGVLTNPNVLYVAHNRGPKDNPWYNGDLIILDPKAKSVRFSSWDK